MLKCSLCREPLAGEDVGSAVLGAALRRDRTGQEAPERSRLLGAFHGQCWETYHDAYSDGLEVEVCPECKGQGMILDRSLEATPEHATEWMLDCTSCSGRGWLPVAA